MPTILRVITTAVIALSLSGGSLYAQSRAKKSVQSKPTNTHSSRGNNDSSTKAISLENSLKLKPKKKLKVIVVPAKALQGSEPQLPEKPVPEK